MEQGSQCPQELYSQVSAPLCKNHFQIFVRNLIRKEFREQFRHPDNAFSVLDKSGTGKTSLKTLLDSLVVKRVILSSKMQSKPLSASDVKHFLKIQGVFGSDGMMDYQTMKRFFFPQLCHALEDGRNVRDSLEA